MSKQRIVNTKFWSDSYILELDSTEKYFFLYLLTNPYCKLSGIFELSKKVISFETGLKITEINSAIKKLQKDKKIQYIDDWIVIHNFVKHQAMNPNMAKSVEQELLALPDNISEKLENTGLLREIQQEINKKMMEDTDEKQTKALVVDDGVINSLDIFKECKHPTGKETEAQQIAMIIELFIKTINPLLGYARKTDRSACKILIQTFGFEGAYRIAKYAISIQAEKYAPVVSSPYQLKCNLSKVGIFQARQLREQADNLKKKNKKGVKI